MDLQLTGKRAFVAGSSKGLGFAIAQLLAGEGCRVAINGRNESTLSDAANRIHNSTQSKILPLTGDLSLPDAPARLIQQVVHEFGGLDLLVTNAGGPPAGKFEFLDDSVWHSAIDLSLLSHVRLIRSAVPELKKSGCASVVTLTSYSVKQPIPNLVLSNSIRSATVGLTKTLSQELGVDGIRFNSVLPGWTLTERVKELMDYRAREKGTSIADEINQLTAEIPLGRMARPEEVANAVVFLLSPLASYITGVMVTVDGGIYKGTL